MGELVDRCVDDAVPIPSCIHPLALDSGVGEELLDRPRSDVDVVPDDRSCAALGEHGAGVGARGDDGKVVALDVKKGDQILFGKWSGSEVKIDNEELLIMKESDILGIID